MARRIVTHYEDGTFSYYLKVTEADRRAAQRAIASSYSERHMWWEWRKAGGRGAIVDLFRRITGRKLLNNGPVVPSQRRENVTPLQDQLARRMAGISLRPQDSNLN